MPEKRRKKNLKVTQHLKNRKTKKVVTKRAKSTAKKVARAKRPVQKAEGSLPVYDLKGKTVSNVTLDPLFHEGPVNTSVIYQSVLQYRAGEREGAAATKDRGHVRGGGKKPWKQKGTGQARHGSRRSPIWRGGGTTFGPMPRDYSYLVPQQIRRSAVVQALKTRAREGKLYVIQSLEMASPKTAEMVGVLEALNVQRPLLVVDRRNTNLTLASRNVRGVAVKTADEMNALDIASHPECVLTQNAYTGLVKRLAATRHSTAASAVPRSNDRGLKS